MTGNQLLCLTLQSAVKTSTRIYVNYFNSRLGIQYDWIEVAGVTNLLFRVGFVILIFWHPPHFLNPPQMLAFRYIAGYEYLPFFTALTFLPAASTHPLVRMRKPVVQWVICSFPRQTTNSPSSGFSWSSILRTDESSTHPTNHTRHINCPRCPYLPRKHSPSHFWLLYPWTSRFTATERWPMTGPYSSVQGMAAHHYTHPHILEFVQLRWFSSLAPRRPFLHHWMFLQSPQGHHSSLYQLWEVLTERRWPQYFRIHHSAARQSR